MIAQFLRMFFVCAKLPSSATLSLSSGEDTKTSPCWQCDHTERAPPVTTLTLLVPAFCGDPGLAVSMTSRRFMGLERIEALNRVRAQHPIRPVVQICDCTGTHHELASKFCTCPVVTDQAEGLGTVHTAATRLANFWTGTGS